MVDVCAGGIDRRSDCFAHGKLAGDAGGGGESGGELEGGVSPCLPFHKFLDLLAVIVDFNSIDFQ